MSTLRHILFFLLLSSIATTASAQVEGGRWMIGLGFAERAGDRALSYMDKSRVMRAPSDPFIMASAAVSYILTEDLRLHAELHYNLWEQLLPELTYAQLPPSHVRREDFQHAHISLGVTDFIEIPLLVSWRLPVGSLPLRVLAGPLLGIVPGGEGDVHLYVMHSAQPRELPVEEIRNGDFAPIFFGAEAGLQLETALSATVALQTDVRFVHQFTPFVDEDFVTWNIPDGIRLRLGVMYRF